MADDVPTDDDSGTHVPSVNYISTMSIVHLQCGAAGDGQADQDGRQSGRLGDAVRAHMSLRAAAVGSRITRRRRVRDA
ncbi:hypothetical protein WM16_21640 [Burkholderia ubonensis]|uniref:Uncharacterized protein n=1 Tax=Burkholderia ubonensis TaxID=101571 RepID=A0A108C861_9BURK|nr:hypothetical protein WM16_21640 [Burkholderia ubonensis]